MTPDRDDDLAREIRAHLELEAEERIAEGATPDAARDAARRAFGNVTRVREDARAVWTPLWLERVRQDLRYAVRMFAKEPAFTATALLTLALGIGANAAIFTVVHGVLLRPLPFPDSGRLVRLFENIPPADGAGGSMRRVPALPLSQLDRQGMVENVAPMSHLLSNSISRHRLYATLLGTFAAVAIVLAMTGIYGVMSYLVTQRTREIGIRMALGAGHGRVIALVLGQAAAVTLIGIGVGLGGAAALTRYLDQLLFGLSALDPATFIGVSVLFATVATLAAFVPARRAARVDPSVTLRFD